ncbi:MAG TPA: FtsK/SpoIIIE domain-containing protein [Jatrophihabitans sp.]|nr:FtsK/SpoIIIE domain-containing protein [Jatrophihabitans sp.]
MSTTFLRLTVRDEGDDRDVEVAIDPAASVASLIDALPVRVNGRACYVGQTPLNPRATVAQSRLVPGAVVSVGAPGPLTRVVSGDEIGKLRVVAGPDAGQAFSLGPGRHRVARDSTAPVALRDGEISRREHAWIEVAPDGRAGVVDSGSTNGTFIDGVRVTGGELHPTSTVRIGSDVLQWSPTAVGALRATRAADGRLDFDRAYSTVPDVSPLEVTMPTRQASHSSQAAAAVTALLTVVASVIVAVVTKRPIVLLASAAGVIGFAVARLIDRKQRGQRDDEYAAACGRIDGQIQAHLANEWAVRRQLAPGPDEVAATVTGTRPDLWARRIDSPHGLTVRVGTADQTAAVTVRGEAWPGFAPPTLAGAPAVVDLRTTGVLGVIGADRDVQDVLRWLLIQLATHRGPDDLRIVVMAADARNELLWSQWLPQVDAGATAPMPCRIGNTPQTRAARVEELRNLIAARQRERGEARVDSEVVVVMDGALTLREMPGMDAILRDGPAAGVYVICADRHGMNECRGLCELGPEGLRLTRTRGDYPITVAPDRLDADTADRFARSLAPMRDRITFAAAQNAIPGKVRLLDLLRIVTPTADDVIAQWRQQDGPRTRVILGADATGPVYVDLAGQGPHTMLGGATGAGKSVLMQTLVTSLLLANRPDELNLVLVDFKGGSAFLPFENCPHVVSLIRSTGETAADVFDEAAAARVLASVRAEVSRRESVLARYNGEIDDYWHRRPSDPGLAALPRLVMVFDEFARVLETSPDFLKELVNVAAKGRSLGMHLVLGTQSLQGKLSAELKNNISLRISLRQNEPAESSEVLGVADAAELPGSLRGRGMIVCTTAENRSPQTFQSGYLGDAPPNVSNGAPASVRALGWAELGTPRPVERAVRAAGPTDQELTIGAIEQAGRRLGVSAPFRPLLPALPATLLLDELAARATSAAPGTAAPFGLTDEPDKQAQPVDHLDLAGMDRLMVAGGPQSGRTTFVRTLITSLATRFGPHEAHIYLFEQYRGGLADYAELPHCGAVFSPADPDRLRRFVDWLGQEVQRRGAGMQAPTAARIVFVVDGWEHFEDHSNPMYVETSVVAKLREIITTGAPVGVHVVALGGHDMLNHKLPTYYSRRLLLPFPKEDTRRAHLNSKMTSPPALPGRAVDAASGRHVQICVSGLPAAELAARVRSEVDPALLPQRFPALPERISIDELTRPDGLPSPTWIPFGVGGPATGTIGIDLFGGPHTLLISGPEGSGRTTAVAALAHGLRRVGVGVLALAPPGSPLTHQLPDDGGIRMITGFTVKDDELRAAAAEFGENPYAMLVDDANLITILATSQGFGEAPTLLEENSQFAARGRCALVVSADATPILSGFGSPLSRLVNSIVAAGTRVLLTPADRSVGAAHNINLERDQFFTRPPGRGYLAAAQTTMLLQLATAS